MKFWPAGIARAAEVVIGLAYLVAAVLKAMDIDAFLPQIHAYQIVQSTSGLVAIALITLVLETALGVSMVLGTPWRRLVLGVSAAMLLVFTGVILYAWLVNGLTDCGCFGKVKVTPPQAIGKNIVLLALTGLAYYGLVVRDGVATPTRGYLRVGISFALALLLCAYAAPQLSVTSPKEVDGPQKAPPTESAKATGPFSNYVIQTDFGETYTLGTGEYLVALLSMDCDHCMESVPQLNDFMFDSTLPPLVALCLEPEEGSMEKFRMITQPQFPMFGIGEKFMNLIPLLESDNSPPRLVFVRDGMSVISWDDDMPDYATLFEGLTSAGFAENVKSE